MTKDIKNKGKKAVTKELGEFKKFIMQGNVLDLAVGVIIGGAFGKIVTSLVNDILTPIIGMCLGGVDFSNLSITIKDANIMYGSFIQNIIDFLIISLCIYTIVRIVNKLTHLKEEEKKEEEKVAPKKDEKLVLLEEIRDLLKNNEVSKKK